MSSAAEKHPEPSLPTSTVMTWYQVTLSAIGDAVLTTDPEGRVTYMNPVAESLTGSPPTGSDIGLSSKGPRTLPSSRSAPMG
ncbi:PAS domain-containing protein [Singulisphaera sp. Ch08]|uniref:PAS domain-containing protein n=1 Tax=Singulisphaera sp. Ch08 TaxID=3120278 RepID=A0AAU7CCA8_9BACT